MKSNLRPAFWPVLLRRLGRWFAHPAAETFLQCFGALAAGFFLAGARVGETWLPLPMCLAAALGLSPPSFAAYAGGCLGYLVFRSTAAALEPMAVGLLVEACLCIFGDQISGKNDWVRPACVMVFTALVGFLFLLEQRFRAPLVWRTVLRVAVAGGGTRCFCLALHGDDRPCRLICLGMLCGGLCAVRLWELPLGAAAACALTAAALDSSAALVSAVLFGLALDLCWSPGCATAVLALASAASLVPGRLLRMGLWLGGVLVGVLLTGTSSLLLASAILGAGLSLLLPARDLFGEPPVPRKDNRLAVTAELLDQLRQCMEPGRRSRADPETAAVFDQAAERVCRMCSLWDDCWNENAGQTVDALERAAPAMMARGKALREDLPALFSEHCSHLEGFLNAVNRELEDLSSRRQCRSRNRESRLVLASQYGILSQALSREVPDQSVSFRFQPEVGFRSRARMEDAVSGDRGVTFRLGRYFYLILCDGMGTGPGAASESGAAISILRTLLQSGAEPAEAMEFLNGIYVLRENGGFATVDLLRADLSSGQAQLLKWGAAPSYLKKRQEVEKIGTATPPPGIGVGEEYRPEETELSLSKGEMLILTSDGAGGEAAERFLRQYTGLSPKELAAGIVSSGSNQAEDDRTAAVITLRPRSLAIS